jgi:hypothetical protein
VSVAAFSAVMALASCGRSVPLPEVAGSLAWVVVEASFAGEPLPGAGAGSPLILVDSIAFPRLGEAAGGDRTGFDELQRQIGRPIEPVDPMDVLECPSRAPCLVRGDATYITIWDAERTRTGLEMVVNRTYNVQGLYRKTTSITHRIELRGAGGAWRLTRRDRL